MNNQSMAKVSMTNTKAKKERKTTFGFFILVFI